MLTQPVTIEVPVNKAAVLEASTVSISTLATPAPPNRLVSFTAGPYANIKSWKQFAAIITAAQDLENTHAYDRSPLKTNRQQQMTQLAIWKVLGLASGKPQDAVTPKRIGNDLLKELSYKVKRDPDLKSKLVRAGYIISPQGNIAVPLKDRKAFDARINTIYQGIDLTIKTAQSARLKDVLPLPDASGAVAKEHSSSQPKPAEDTQLLNSPSSAPTNN